MAVNIGPRIEIEGYQKYKKDIDNIIQQQKTLKSEMKETSSAWDKNTKAEKKAADQKKALNDQIKVQEERVKMLSDMVDKSAQKYGEADTKTLKWKEALNNANAELNNMKNELKNLPSDVELLGKKFEESGEKIKNAGQAIEGAGKKLAPLSGAAAAGLGAAIKTTADFDAQMSKVAAISGVSNDEFQQLRDTAREMGAATKFSATEAGQGFEYMAMAGWKSEQMLAGIAPILNLAAASGEELGTTSDIVTDALTAFGLQAEDTAHFADVLAAASSNANTNVSMLGESFKYAAPVAGALGYDVEDVAVALGLMANAGIKGSQAGTSLRNIFQRMAKPTKESAAAMARLGVSLQDEGGNMYSFMEIMEQLRESMGNIKMPTEDFTAAAASLDDQLAAGNITQKEYRTQMDELLAQTFNAEDAEKARAAAMLGGARAMSGLLAITNASEADFTKLSTAVTNSSQDMALLKDGSIVPLSEAMASGAEVMDTYSGSAATMAAVMQDNLTGDVTILKSALSELAISIGDLLMPSIRELTKHAQSAVDWMNGLSDSQKTTATKILLVTAAISPLLIVIGKLITSVGTIIGVVGKLVPAIAAINPVTALIVAGIAAVIAIGVELYKNWDYIKAKAAEFAANVSAKWNLLKTTIVNNAKGAMNDAKAAFDRLKTSISTIVDNIKTKVSTTWENIKTKISNTVENIKTKVTNTFDNMKTSIGNKIENIKTTVANKFDNIKDKITKTIETARDNVKDAVDRIKGFFDFEWKLPDIKLPHFSISGEFSLVPPSVPHIDVDWYAKAMRNGMILNGPTIFGAQNGRLMGGGEAGPEVVVGASSLMGMIQGAVSNTYNNGGNNVYVYGAPGQDVKELAKEVADIIDGNIYQEQAVFA